MILSLITLLVFVCFGISSGIAMDDKPNQDPTTLKVNKEIVYSQDDEYQEKQVTNQQTLNQQIPSQQTPQQEVQSHSFLVGAVKYVFGLLNEEEKEKFNQDYNPLYFNFDDAFKDLRV